MLIYSFRRIKHATYHKLEFIEWNLISSKSLKGHCAKMIVVLWENIAVAHFVLYCFKNGEFLAPLALSTHNGIRLSLKSKPIAGEVIFDIPIIIQSHDESNC